MYTTTVTLFNFYPMMNVTHRARHHRHIYGMVVRGPDFHNLRGKKKKKKKKKKNCSKCVVCYNLTQFI